MPIKIWGRYKKAKAEEIDTAESSEEADRFVGEYRMAYGAEWLIWKGRKKDGEGTQESDVSLRGSGNVLRFH